jgi:hypothetical protein
MENVSKNRISLQLILAQAGDGSGLAVLGFYCVRRSYNVLFRNSECSLWLGNYKLRRARNPRGPEACVPPSPSSSWEW